MDDLLARQRTATLAFWRAECSPRPAGAWAQIGDVQVHTTGLAPRQWSGAFVTRAVASPTYTAVASWFRERSQDYAVLVPAELDHAPPGCSHLLDQPVMLRPLAEPVAADLAGLHVSWTPPAEDVAIVQALAFDVDLDLSREFVGPTLAVHPAVVAYDGDLPVACASAAVTGDVLGVFGVAVRASHRRRRIGRAVTALALERGRDLGCDLAYLNPSLMAYAGYARLGFTDAPPMRVWVPEPDS